jgi:hypothetical protein
MSNKDSKITIQAPVRNAGTSIKNDDTILSSQPPLTDWHGIFTSNKLGPLVIKGKVETKARCPVKTTVPYTIRISIKYEGLYNKGSRIEVDALVSPSGEMHITVGEGKDVRKIVFTADNRTLTEVTGKYRVYEGPMQDTGTFRLTKGVAGFLQKLI